MITASICTIGDEILIGQITDTNSAAIATELNRIGVRVTNMVSIGDDHDAIVRTLRSALASHDIVICTGGLGPTKDDITKAALAELSCSKGYIVDQRQNALMHSILSARGIDNLESNLSQAKVPDRCEVIPNKCGTAPIMVFRLTDKEIPGCSGTHVLYSMPGVPFETRNALPDVMADIRRHFALTDIYHKSIMTYGIAESALAEKIAPWEASLPEDMHLAYLPSPLTGVKLRLSIYGGDKAREMKRIDAEFDTLKTILGNTIYSDKEDTLEHALAEILSAHGKTLSAAESCTGGEISHLITSVPGSSAYYIGSVTSYAIPVKEKVLGVSSTIIDSCGVVSSEVAAAMAKGVMQLMKSDYAVATTGLAGPGGGDGINPDGTVWIGVCSASGLSATQKFIYKGDRIRNIQRFAASALYTLLNLVKKDLNL